MKIEIGESLVYTWLRHVKNCQIVQNNWKVSPKWNISHEKEIFNLFDVFKEKYKNSYNIFKKNTYFQFIYQGEADAVGINCEDKKYYGVDVAYHINGLNYGSKNETIAKVLEKCVRTAACFYAYLNVKDANVIFISPKIGKSMLSEIDSEIEKLQKIFNSLGFGFVFKIISNEKFVNDVLEPVKLLAHSVDDTAELFLRSYQLLDLSNNISTKSTSAKRATTVVTSSSVFAAYDKIGTLVKTLFIPKLVDGSVSKAEISKMTTLEYSKKTFGLQYPLLIERRDSSNSVRYYSEPIKIYWKEYYVCSQWFQTTSNNDRPLLEEWLINHL